MVKAEYLRRGRPLRKTKWTIDEVKRFMAVHTSNCNQDDLGAHAKFFDDAPSDGKSPMPSFVLEAEAEEASEVP